RKLYCSKEVRAAKAEYFTPSHRACHGPSPVLMLGLSSTKAVARMKETTLFGRVGGLHTQISTSAGGSKSIDETWWLGAQAASWCSDELISKCSFRTARLTRKPRTAACRRTTACSCDDGHGLCPPVLLDPKERAELRTSRWMK
ncbi:hypothetical protein ACJX0J_028732, partial [Zea mays]